MSSQNLEYIGGSARKRKILAGFQAPEPNVIIQTQKETVAGKPKQKRQSKFKKNNEIMKEVFNAVDDMVKTTGLDTHKTIKQIETELNKERVKMRALVKKAGTQVKKMCLNKGMTKTQAKNEKQRFIDASKEGLKKVELSHKLVALKQYNNNLKM